MESPNNKTIVKLSANQIAYAIKEWYEKRYPNSVMLSVDKWINTVGDATWDNVELDGAEITVQPAEEGRFKIYYWDTFEPPGKDTFLVGEAPTLEAAKQFVTNRYADQILEIVRHKGTGADKVQVVDTAGHVVATYNVG